MAEEILTARTRKRQRGQSLVEFAISSTVLLLLAMGLIDLSRAFYYAVALQGAAREGARHAAWFNTASRANIYLDDTEVGNTVIGALAGSGLTAPNQVKFIASPGGCLAPTDGNAVDDKPYPLAAYPPTPQTVYIYACYTRPNNGPSVGTLTSAPTDDSWKLGDVNVMVLMNFQLITPFIQGLYGNGLYLAYNEHFTIQGKP